MSRFKNKATWTSHSKLSRLLQTHTSKALTVNIKLHRTHRILRKMLVIGTYIRGRFGNQNKNLTHKLMQALMTFSRKKHFIWSQCMA